MTQHPRTSMDCHKFFFVVELSRVFGYIRLDALWRFGKRLSICAKLTRLCLFLFIVNPLHLSHKIVKRMSQETESDLTRRDIIKLIAVANKQPLNLMGVNLSGVDLSNLDLTDANLCHADLSNTDLHGTCLNGAKLCYANLISANMPYAKLWNADLTCANLTDASLCYADLTGVNLCEANLTNADVYRASTGAHTSATDAIANGKIRTI